MSKRILILYTELAGYTMSCLKALENTGVTIHLVRYPVNIEAPFEFSFSSNIHVYNRSELSRAELIQLAENIQPDILLVSGWMDKDYVAVAKQWRNRIPTIVAMDNKWEGTLKQRLAVFAAPYLVLNAFNSCWVPGIIQKEFALRLGFKPENVKTGFYTADTHYFSEIYSQGNDRHVPHRFVYSGRYYDFKGVRELWDAFASWKMEQPNDWKLVCMGTGDISGAVHPDIEHLGFVQPDRLRQILLEGGVFILPSRIEPWAVVVQEYAAAGYPLLLSKNVGACEAFLIENKNGFSFEANNVNAIKNTFAKVNQLSAQELSAMKKVSHELGIANSPQQWSATLFSFMP